MCNRTQLKKVVITIPYNCVHKFQRKYLTEALHHLNYDSGHDTLWHCESKDVT